MDTIATIESANCDKGLDLLAYLFDELPQGVRDRVEAHLSECDRCVDEFAEISQARYPVYEWKQLTFDPLPTPEFERPLREAGFVGAIAAYLRLLWTPNGLKVAGAFAAMAVMVTVGMLVLRRAENSVPTENVATAGAQPQNLERVVKTNAASHAVESAVVREGEVAQNLRAADEAPVPVAAKASSSRRKVARRAPIQGFRTEVAEVRGDGQKKKDPSNKIGAVPTKVPVLAQFDEVEDNSLRLAELFDDIGSRD